MSELMPCPFCPPDESDPKLFQPADWMAFVKCCSCGCTSGPVCSSAESAVRNWNTRHDRTCENVYEGREFECSECGTQWHLLDRMDAFEEWEHVRTPGFCPKCGAKVVAE